MRYFCIFAGLILSVTTLLGCTPKNEVAESSPTRFSHGRFLCRQKQGEFISDFLPRTQTKPPTTIPPEQNAAKKYTTPTRKLAPAEWPDLDDDLDLADLDTAIDRQIAHFKHHLPQGTIQLGDDVYPLTQAQKSMEVMHGLIDEYKHCRKSSGQGDCDLDLTEAMKAQFNMYAPDLEPSDPHYGEERPGLFTGYYTPILNASNVAQNEYPHAIYGRPATEELSKQPREKIDFEGVLSHQGLELSYGASLFDLYLTHIQGSAHIIIDNDRATSYYADYAATNQQEFNFISIYMKDMGYIDNESIDSQRDFLAAHPEKAKEIYSTCPSYVYLRKTQDLPTGSGSVPVTENRSIATDDRYYLFKGVLAFISSQRPEPDQDHHKECADVTYQTFSRFFVDQDTGGGVRGKDRADIYFGEGHYAEFAAFNEAERGDIYFFMLKK